MSSRSARRGAAPPTARRAWGAAPPAAARRSPRPRGRRRACCASSSAIARRPGGHGGSRSGAPRRRRRRRLARGLHGLDLLGAPAGALLGPAPWVGRDRQPLRRERRGQRAGRTPRSGRLAPRRRGRRGLALVAWGGAAASFALFGHAATAAPRWLTAPAVAVHAGAFSSGSARCRGSPSARRGPRRELCPKLHRFSKLAVPLVGLLVAERSRSSRPFRFARPAALLRNGLRPAADSPSCSPSGSSSGWPHSTGCGSPRQSGGAHPAAIWFRRSVLGEDRPRAHASSVLTSGFRLAPPPASALAARSGRRSTSTCTARR